MDYKYIEIHFGEIWLRGRNRAGFISMLIRNIEHKLEGEAYSKIENANDRLLIHLSRSSDIDSILKKLGYVFGISWYAPVMRASNNIKSIMKKANELAVLSGIKKLKVIAHRSIKSTNFNSYEIVSSFLRNSKSMRFVLDKNSIDKLYINVTKEGALLHINRLKGLGGLPVGSSGKAVILLSGGIDSPVAAFMAMKRGIEPVYLHMHALQSNEEAMHSKVAKIISVLSMYSFKPKAYFAPSHFFQLHVMKIGKRYGRYETVLFKRFLMKLAEHVASYEGAVALVTGESIGQVSSQTIRNMKASESGIGPFVIRPLISFDKSDIIEIAKSIYTFDLSIIKYKDVCSINSHNPKTNAAPNKIDELYDKAGLSDALALTIEKMSKVHV